MLLQAAVVANAWLSTKREELFARLRLLFDFLQVTGLLMTLAAHEPRWFVVRSLLHLAVLLPVTAF